METLFQRVSGGPLGAIVQPDLASRPVQLIDDGVARFVPQDVLPHLLEVIDGDGVKKDGISCRLKGYDAPEIFRPRSKTDPRLEMVRGYRALHRLRSLIRDATSLQIVMVKPRGGGFGRDLVSLIVNGKDVSVTACDEGWGRVWRKGQKIDWGEEMPLGLPFPDDFPVEDSVASNLGLNEEDKMSPSAA